MATAIELPVTPKHGGTQNCAIQVFYAPLHTATKQLFSGDLWHCRKESTDKSTAFISRGLSILQHQIFWGAAPFSAFTPWLNEHFSAPLRA